VLKLRKLYWRLRYKLEVLSYTLSGIDLPWQMREVEYNCPNCNWYTEDNYDNCLGSYNHHSDWNGGEYWTERWNCPRCGEVFEIEASN
jgi:predicted RNA-binding Zn-ribbon protein involved in translation (DUF1610 family)